MKICRIFGLDVKVDRTLLLLIFLIVMNIESVLISRFQNMSVVLAYFMSIIFAFSFVLSIFAHEMGHVIVGRKYGVTFSSITLFILGGVAQMDSSPRSPKGEAIMAVAGPITNFGLAILLSICIIVARALGIDMLVSEEPVLTLISFLIHINLVLGVFNLVPMFPTDGGRILRAIIWQHQRNFLSATVTAVKISHGFSYGLIMSGILMVAGFNIPFFGTGFGSGIWIAVIGLLIIVMAKQELKMTRRLFGGGM